MLLLKNSLFLKCKKHEKYEICVMDLICHRGITLIQFGRSVVQPISLFDVYLFVPFHLMALNPLLKKCFSDLNLYEAVKSSDLVVQLKLKCLLVKPSHDDIIEAGKVYIQLSFENYKGKYMLRN